MNAQPSREIMHRVLDGEDWPSGAPTVLADPNEDELDPDGAVVGEDGCLWNAQWDAASVARHSPEGDILSTVAIPAAQVTCRTLGGAGLDTLHVASAADRADAGDAQAGMTFAVAAGVRGQAEHGVKP